MVIDGTIRIDDDGQGWATPTIVRISTDDLLRQRERLLDETFGPLSVLVEYDDEGSLSGLADELFQGNLTGTVHAGRDEDSADLRALVDWIARHAGRVLFDGWPTGVAVTAAQQHGGPWPATTNDSGTSVGTAAISRFLARSPIRVFHNGYCRSPYATIIRGMYRRRGRPQANPSPGDRRMAPNPERRELSRRPSRPRLLDPEGMIWAVAHHGLPLI